MNKELSNEFTIEEIIKENQLLYNDFDEEEDGSNDENQRELEIMWFWSCKGIVMIIIVDFNEDYTVDSA